MQVGFVMLGQMRAKVGYQASSMHYCAGKVHSFQRNVRGLAVRACYKKAAAQITRATAPAGQC
jgi:hypothetical protein